MNKEKKAEKKKGEKKEEKKVWQKSLCRSPLQELKLCLLSGPYFIVHPIFEKGSTVLLLLLLCHAKVPPWILRRREPIYCHCPLVAGLPSGLCGKKEPLHTVTGSTDQMDYLILVTFNKDLEWTCLQHCYRIFIQQFLTEDILFSWSSSPMFSY